MNLLETLQAHTEVCEEMYRLMLELNRTLKSGPQLPDSFVLDRQRAGLATLESSLTRLRSHGGPGGSPSPEVRSMMEKCQRTILKALLLDRENEQLLLKNAMVRPRAGTPAKPAPGHLAKIYARHH